MKGGEKNLSNIMHSSDNIKKKKESNQMNFSKITPEVLIDLKSKGVTPEQIAELALQQGQEVPPIVLSAIQYNKGNTSQSLPNIANVNMSTNLEKQQTKYEELSKKPIIKRSTSFGYVFSDLLMDDIKREVKRTQGSFLIGVNLLKLFQDFKKIINPDTTLQEKETQKTDKKTSNEVFKKYGEFLDQDYEEILKSKLGFRDSSGISHLPELKLDETSTFDEIIDESKEYADIGYKGKITPFGLLIMTRMLYKYKKNEEQWIRVATVLELIYKFLGGNQSRQHFFNSRDEIPILALLDLEEFYNTDHIFMLPKELDEFKKNLEYYKYDISQSIEHKLNRVGNIVENLNQKKNK